MSRKENTRRADIYARITDLNVASVLGEAMGRGEHGRSHHPPRVASSPAM